MNIKNLNIEMINEFGEEALVYTSLVIIEKLKLGNNCDDSLIKVGIPWIIGNLRFTLEFDPILRDPFLKDYSLNCQDIYVIGCMSPTLVIGRCLNLDKIGLSIRASLQDIAKKLILLDTDLYPIFDAEVKLSWRICFEARNNGLISYIDPTEGKFRFFATSFLHMAKSLILYSRMLSQDIPFEIRLNEFKSELMKIDHLALINSDTLWNKIITQHEIDYRDYTEE